MDDPLSCQNQHLSHTLHHTVVLWAVISHVFCCGSVRRGNGDIQSFPLAQGGRCIIDFQNLESKPKYKKCKYCVLINHISINVNGLAHSDNFHPNVPFPTTLQSVSSSVWFDINFPFRLNLTALINNMSSRLRHLYSTKSSDNHTKHTHQAPNRHIQ